MRTPALAILWEVWRPSRLRLAVAVFVAVAALAMLYLCRRALGERIFGTRWWIAVLGLGAAVGAGIVYFPVRWGVADGELTAASIPPIGLIVLLPFLAMMSAPWSFARLRHR